MGDQLEMSSQDLRAKGVAFEHYDLPDTTRDGDIHETGGMRGSVVQRSDGNIIGLVNQSNGRRWN